MSCAVFSRVWLQNGGVNIRHICLKICVSLDHSHTNTYLGKYHEDMEQWIVTTSQKTVRYISPQTHRDFLFWLHDSDWRKNSFWHFHKSFSIFLSDTIISASCSWRRVSTFSPAFRMSLSFGKLFYVFKSDSTAALMFPRTGMFNKDSSDFRHARKESFFFFHSSHCRVEL